LKRPEFLIDRASFTNTGAFAREIMALLEYTDLKLIAVVHNGRQEEELYNEMEAFKTMGRVVVKRDEA
jgi:hypothetical protein